VLRADRNGSSWPVLVETDGGVFYTKLLGAAQAPASLVAEIIVGSIAEAIGLQVPDRVFVDIPPRIHVDDPYAELAQLLRGSVGRNLGFAHLQDARTFQPADLPRIDAELAAKILWLDGLVQNPDRTAKNPNLLWSRGRLWLIDHGASLGFQHRWRDVTEDSPRAPGWPRRDHVMWSRVPEVGPVDGTLSNAVTREVLEAAVDEVPQEYLGSGLDTSRRRAAYVAFLWKRLKEPRPFLDHVAAPS
jgi:HipA-like protein